MALLDNKQRIITALVLLGVIVLALFTKGWLFTGIVALVASIALWEFFGLFWSGPARIISRVMAIALACAMIASAGSSFLNLPFELPSTTGILSAAFLLFALTFLFSYGVKDKETLLGEFFPLICGIVYVVLPLTLIFQLTTVEMCLVLLAAIVSDTTAYYIGTKFGKHKLWQSVSPKKSWEGSVGGMLACCIIVLAMGLIFSPFQSITTAGEPPVSVESKTASPQDNPQKDNTATAPVNKNGGATASSAETSGKEAVQQNIQLVPPSEIAAAVAPEPAKGETVTGVSGNSGANVPSQSDNGVTSQAKPDPASSASTAAQEAPATAGQAPVADSTDEKPAVGKPADNESSAEPVTEADEQAPAVDKTKEEASQAPLFPLSPEQTSPTPAPKKETAPDAAETKTDAAANGTDKQSENIVQDAPQVNSSIMIPSAQAAQNTPSQPVKTSTDGKLPAFPLVAWLVLGVALNIAAQFGDFFESALKRSMQVKDTGSMLPGHGGMLDRIDSFLFVVPVYVACKYLILLIL